jgi:hypothetical protein
MKRKHAVAAITVASLGLVACALVRVAYPAPVILTDEILAATRGGESSSWCWPMFTCEGNPGFSCPGTLDVCVGKQENERCTAYYDSIYFNPECCNTTLGNETCSVNPSYENVLCRKTMYCICVRVGDEKQCYKPMVWLTVCLPCYTESYCYYRPCPP